jgi:ribonuclease P protein component
MEWTWGFEVPICIKNGVYEVSSIAKKISKFTKREIDHLYKHARRVFRDGSCTILLAPQQEDFARALIITSRKVGNAPERNLIRRRIKSIFYEEKLYERGFDCAFIAQKKATALSFDQLKTIMLGMYKKAAQ